MGFQTNRTTIYIAAAIVLIVIIAAAVYIATRQAPETVETETGTAAETTPATKTEAEAVELKPLTGNVREDIVNIARFLSANGVTEAKYRVHGSGDPNSIMRVYGIVEAAARLNKILEDEGVNFKIVIEDIKFSANADEPAKVFQQSFPLKQEADIIAVSYRWISTFAKEGYLLDITDYANAYMGTELEDYYDSLWSSVTYKGRIYALPQDTEARPLYILKPVMECLGYDAWDIAKKIDSGEYTWKDVMRIAKEAVDNGCSEWGVIHRKGSAHPDLVQFYYAFGGEFTGSNPDKLYLNLEALYKWLAVEYALARNGLTPENMLEWDWAKQIHPTIVSAKTAFDIGGTWYWTEWQTKKYYTDPQTGEQRGLTPEEVKERFAYSLFPAGEPGKKPVTLSQPFVWMISANAGKLNPKYDDLKEAYHRIAFLLILKANDPDLVAIHSIVSAHIPIREKAAQLMDDQQFVNKLAQGNLDMFISDEARQAFVDIAKKTAHPINIEFLKSVTYMLEYTHIPPLHPSYQPLAEFFKDAVDFVLKGQMTPEEATNYVVQKIQADPELAETIEIVGSIPTGWEISP
ncbi:ABC transporter substrate-binding protein [Aeropyrum camini]|uniref:ABC transporter substrate-binding protein n=1 Tax=Aeropyrum camini SY1 = JCM 12091 TaxID=1198449 RepID=U3TFR0_9CREN|nr:extracellular solute-binding protein [Aeropyrum camini]BAN90880.1 ABC transporter substrate-binding protein [Aeropyrum camini SY1 = JCM 12091]